MWIQHNVVEISKWWFFFVFVALLLINPGSNSIKGTPQFTGHLARSRGCPLIRGSTVFQSVTEELNWGLSLVVGLDLGQPDCRPCMCALTTMSLTASICSPSFVPVAGHQPLIRFRSKRDTISMLCLECSNWSKLQFRAFLAGLGSLHKFNSSWPSNNRTNESG